MPFLFLFHSLFLLLLVSIVLLGCVVIFGGGRRGKVNGRRRRRSRRGGTLYDFLTNVGGGVDDVKRLGRHEIK